MPGIITPPASLPVRQTAFWSLDVVVPTLIYEDEHLSGYFQLPMSAHEASFTCSMVSRGASVDPLVLSPVFIMKGKVSARRSTTAVMDPHPAFLPAVPVLVQILVVTEWYLDEMWEDFLALLSLTQNTTIWCMSTRSFHLASHVSGFLGKEINIWKGILSLAHSI